MEIKVDEEVFAALKALAKHPNEGLNTVLRRMLMQEGGQRTDITSKGGRSHARRTVRPRFDK